MSRIKATERQMESDKNTLIMEENNLKSALDEKSNDLEKSRHLISDLSATVLNAQNENHRSAGEIVRLQSTVNDLTTQYNELQTRIAELSKPSSPIPARSVENRDSTMIVYTVGSLNRRSKKRPEIFVDEYPYAFIVPFTYVTLTFPHGLHTVCIADYFDPCETVEVYLVPKSTAYVRVDITDDGPRRFRPSLQGADTGHSESHALNPISNDKIINHSAD
jgi:hypothetical protein